MWKVAPLLVILGLNYITGKLKLMYILKIKKNVNINLFQKKKNTHKQAY